MLGPLKVFRRFTPEGIRNNNPGNLLHSDKFEWHGETRPDYKGKACFISPQYGLRACLLTFHTYQEVHKLITPEQMLLRYAPPPNNNVEAYIKDVCDRIGCRRDLLFDLDEGFEPWLRAITHHENGMDPYSKGTYYEAYTLSTLR